MVLFEDEASLSNTAGVSYAWSEKGKQPKVFQSQRKRERRTLFGAVNPHSGELIVDTAESGTTKTFFSFLVKCVRAFTGKKIYMVLDNVRFHHAKRLKPVLERYRESIELIFLPSYSPDLNPIERVWWLIRKQVTHNRWVKSMEQRLIDFHEWHEHTSGQQIMSVCNLIENIY
ncbi:MAG: IS630 family transposase [Dysgonamonadaceae bacterium]|nr:IS630 family transposase [Dysgonamonadaceae bacterium]